MQNLVREYEENRAALQSRIQHLDMELKREELGNRERDMLLLRRSTLAAERLEMLQAMQQMRPYCTEEGSAYIRC